MVFGLFSLVEMLQAEVLGEAIGDGMIKVLLWLLLVVGAILALGLYIWATRTKGKNIDN